MTRKNVAPTYVKQKNYPSGNEGRTHPGLKLGSYFGRTKGSHEETVARAADRAGASSNGGSQDDHD
jgi:hypothetical protein